MDFLFFSEIQKISNGFTGNTLFCFLVKTVFLPKQFCCKRFFLEKKHKSSHLTAHKKYNAFTRKNLYLFKDVLSADDEKL